MMPEERTATDYSTWRDAVEAQDYPAALERVGFQRAKQAMIPLEAELTPDQRALAETMAASEGWKKLWGWAIPNQQWKVRRWLGLEPPGVLERAVTYSHDGREYSEPLWRAMHRRNDGGNGMNALLHQLGLPIADRLDVFADAYRGAYNLKVRATRPRHSLTWGAPDEIASGLGEWGAHTAAALTAGGHGSTGLDIKWPVFLALVRGDVEIDSSWDWLMPAGYGPEADLARECVDAIPQHRRAAAACQAVRSLTFASAIVRAGLALLSTHPSSTLTQLVLEHSAGATKGTDAMAKSETLETLAEIGSRQSIVNTVVVAYSKNYSVPVLTVIATLAPTTADDLSVVQREQLRVAGTGYDGADLSATERLIADADLEASFFGTLEIRTIGDEEGTPQYDAFTYAADSGTVFAHNTTEIVAEIIQAHTECAAPGLQEAIRLCLDTRTS